MKSSDPAQAKAAGNYPVRTGDGDRAARADSLVLTHRFLGQQTVTYRVE
ncbi:MAG: hypothetical protein WBO69_01000 [Thermoanaerobaculia bacterium]